MDELYGYICDAEKSTPLLKLKETIEEAQKLMEETKNLILSWTTEGKTSMRFS